MAKKTGVRIGLFLIALAGLLLVVLAAGSDEAEGRKPGRVQVAGTK